MTAWNRRVAAATRVREAGEPDALEDKLRALGLPTGMHPDDIVAVATLLRIAETRGTGFGTTLLARVADTDGSIRTVQVVVLGNEGGATTLCGKAEDEIEIDSLTGLPRRQYTMSEIDRALQATLHGDGSVAVFSIDIDRFKTVNDSRGFREGNEALRSLARALEGLLRPDDTLARLGGDEFTVVCPEIFGVAEAMTVAERFRALCSEASIDSPLAGLTVSVGVSLGRSERSAEDMLRDAETALYQAKGLGRDRCEVFDEELHTKAGRRITVDQQLRRALDEDGIQVHFQPIVETQSRRVVGFEALLRIVGHDGQHLNPQQLVEAAKDGGLIRRIEEIVLQRGAETMLSLPEDDDPLFSSVNVSDRQLADSRFPLALARTLNDSGLAAEQLHLKVNRSILERKGAAIRLVTQLRALGVVVAIDEFIGASDADLVVPDGIDLIKLDKRLVHGVHGERGRARAELVVSGIRDRQVEVCAVGVETDDDLRVVAELGCHYAQGYLISPPVDSAQLRALVVADRSV
ncbi:MAG: bifunctional diguanylate cyclase/phosphodiesterase [Acidimicrobiales bacterium]|jgi:diguanylate cyclase (GGDEF)-like protein|nr:bifunctional diguanylate cyclase/phosphodiesterase [Acidimicrobiales bacterium]